MAPAKPTPQLDQRRRDFGACVRRVLDAAKQRGMTIKQIEEATDVGSSTFYGWRDGRWTRDPVATLVNRFFDALTGSRAEAYRALRWSEEPHARRHAPEPIIDDPDVRQLLRKLNDPKTSAGEKLMIRRTVRALAGNPPEQTDQ